MDNSGKELSAYLFHQGTNYYSYEYLGAHKSENNRLVFRLWAPHADKVFLVGDFNSWKENYPLKRITENGVFEIYVDKDIFTASPLYKYKIVADGKEFYKADPYGYYFENPPATATKYYDIDGFEWQDDKYLSFRKEKFKKGKNMPMNIYELNLGSFMKKENGDYLSYRELATEIISYVKQMGYTHIELMPIAEHPYDGSWGYQVCGYYAPTSRFGTPHDFMEFINRMHLSGIGVILDWVPAHFPKDAHGLYEFDGQPLYEFQGDDRMEHKIWGTRKFDIARNEVECFLISNACFWAKMYHADGLRIDAVASMLYLDFDKKGGEWFPNIYGTNESLEAIAFFKKLGSVFESYFPDCMLIAEESTSWKNVTRKVSDGGLGFDYKWNMGWMNDTLSYISMDPVYRKYHHDKVTFPMMYAYSENYILPISHDEVVHGKKSLLDKMYGDYYQKFASDRSFFTYMMTHPGKKLMFMGCEIGQFKEWDYGESIEWFLLDYPMHKQFQSYVREINLLYLSKPPLYECDDSWEGFKWINADNRDVSILSYRRIDKLKNELIVVINFTPVFRENLCIGVPYHGIYKEILNSDDVAFGGSGIVNSSPLKSEKKECDGLDYTLKINIAPLGSCIIEPQKSKDTKKES